MVTVTEVDTAREAWDVFDVNQLRHALWSAGCNPDDPVGHADCGDTCGIPGWADAGQGAK